MCGTRCNVQLLVAFGSCMVVPSVASQGARKHEEERLKECGINIPAECGGCAFPGLRSRVAASLSLIRSTSRIKPDSIRWHFVSCLAFGCYIVVLGQYDVKYVNVCRLSVHPVSFQHC